MGAEVIGATRTIIPHTVGLKQQTFLPHGSRGWEVQDQSSGKLASGGVCLLCSHVLEGLRELFAVSCIV